MGSGKSSVAALLDRDAIDLDREIEQKTGYTIMQIFDRFSASYFRWIEAQLLRSVCPNGRIIAVGGGCPFYYHNMEYMRRQAKTVYLRCNFDSLYDRIKDDKSRPLVRSLDRVSMQALFDRREALYMTADIIFDMPDDLAIAAQKLNKFVK